jgi:hypothetical protein
LAYHKTLKVRLLPLHRPAKQPGGK